MSNVIKIKKVLCLFVLSIVIFSTNAIAVESPINNLNVNNQKDVLTKEVGSNNVEILQLVVFVGLIAILIGFAIVAAHKKFKETRKWRIIIFLTIGIGSYIFARDFVTTISCLLLCMIFYYIMHLIFHVIGIITEGVNDNVVGINPASWGFMIVIGRGIKNIFNFLFIGRAIKKENVDKNEILTKMYQACKVVHIMVGVWLFALAYNSMFDGPYMGFAYVNIIYIVVLVTLISIYLHYTNKMMVVGPFWGIILACIYIIQAFILTINAFQNEKYTIIILLTVGIVTIKNNLIFIDSFKATNESKQI